MSDALTNIVRDRLAQQVAPEAKALAYDLIAHHGTGVRAVLFYGSCLRDKTAEGVLDFYVIVDRYSAFHDMRLMASANAVLPPNVLFFQRGDLAAKVAVISAKDFTRRMHVGSLDTTIWARFCQPSALIYARDADVADEVRTALARGIATAAGWATRLGPEGGTPAQLWTALFQQTYRAELRVENGQDRARTIYDSAARWFDQILAPALDHARLDRHPQWRDRQAAQSAWTRRVVFGKPQNFARVMKGVFTFENGVDYVAWKIERHTGRKVELSPFQRRHPLIAAPVLLPKLLRQGFQK